MKYILKFTILILFFLLTLTSCDMVNKNLVMAYFDKDDKSITLSTGTDPLILGMKEVLMQNNWTVLTFNDSFDQDSITYSAINTRYLMVSEYDQGDDIWYGEFVRDYEFTIYDVDSESEVVVLYGSQQTVEEVLDVFEVIIKSNDAE